MKDLKGILQENKKTRFLKEGLGSKYSWLDDERKKIVIDLFDFLINDSHIESDKISRIYEEIISDISPVGDEWEETEDDAKYGGMTKGRIQTEELVGELWRKIKETLEKELKK